VPELTRKLYELTTSGRLDEARTVQGIITRIFDLMLFSADFPEGARVGVRLRGIRMGPSRQPYSDEHRGKLEELENRLREILAEQGLMDAGSPAVFPAGFDPAQVGQIVAGVLAELRQRASL
jgi:4-hydroxy-tetrahydrodipicolinate synthase